MARPSPEQIMTSAIALAQSIMAADALLQHKHEFLSACIWKITEAAGKYKVPYWSEGVLALVREHGSIDKVLKLRPLPVHHEHVHTRKSLVQAIMKHPESLETILRENTTACLVTQPEHLRLDETQTGFDRYTSADIRIWHVTTQNWLT